MPHRRSDLRFVRWIDLDKSLVGYCLKSVFPNNRNIGFLLGVREGTLVMRNTTEPETGFATASFAIE